MIVLHGDYNVLIILIIDLSLDHLISTDALQYISDGTPAFRFTCTCDGTNTDSNNSEQLIYSI